MTTLREQLFQIEENMKIEIAKRLHYEKVFVLVKEKITESLIFKAQNNELQYEYTANVYSYLDFHVNDEEEFRYFVMNPLIKYFKSEGMEAWRCTNPGSLLLKWSTADLANARNKQNYEKEPIETHVKYDDGMHGPCSTTTSISTNSHEKCNGKIESSLGSQAEELREYEKNLPASAFVGETLKKQEPAKPEFPLLFNFGRKIFEGVCKQNFAIERKDGETHIKFS